MFRKLRENAHLPRDGWSKWVKAMVPDGPDDEDYENRGDRQDGLMCTNIKHALPERCGIYEWRVERTDEGQPNVVVYVGSTCRNKQGALRSRILEYCTNGSHKHDLINDALLHGYELSVRVKITGSRLAAEKEENELLNKYDYAWNIRNNGNIRDIMT